jgi:2-polyprenyl-3-methyl-5-hydroxy-6-metoxy-1,4-benzoquinol methylase
VNGFDVVACTCGLARTVLPPGFDPASIYSEAYFQGGHTDGYADYRGSVDALHAEFRSVVTSLTKHVARGRLIELGCAFGYFLDEAKAHFEVCGVEISDDARAACVERGLDVVRELTPELTGRRGPFDAAVMLDVLEHMPRPDETLDQLAEAMRPGGKLLITTGDWGSLLARAMGKRWRLMTPPQHLWFFNRETLTRLLEAKGFRVVDFTHPWKQVPLNLVTYQLTRYLKSQSLLRRLNTIPGAIPLNLFDAMRVVAERW